MKRWVSTLLQIALAIAAGLGSAWAVLKSTTAFGEPIGPWRVSTLAGSADADLYTRARVALGGLLVADPARDLPAAEAARRSLRCEAG